jgi:hypothetical protein
LEVMASLAAVFFRSTIHNVVYLCRASVRYLAYSHTQKAKSHYQINTHRKRPSKTSCPRVNTRLIFLTISVILAVPLVECRELRSDSLSIFLIEEILKPSSFPSSPTKGVPSPSLASGPTHQHSSTENNMSHQSSGPTTTLSSRSSRIDLASLLPTHLTTYRAVLTRPLQHHWAVFSGVCIKHGAITMICSMVTVGKKHTVFHYCCCHKTLERTFCQPTLLLSLSSSIVISSPPQNQHDQHYLRWREHILPIRSA